MANHPPTFCQKLGVGVGGAAGLRLKGVYPPPPLGDSCQFPKLLLSAPPLPPNRFATASTATATALQPPVTAAAAALETPFQPPSPSNAALGAWEGIKWAVG